MPDRTAEIEDTARLELGKFGLDEVYGQIGEPIRCTGPTPTSRTR